MEKHSLVKLIKEVLLEVEVEKQNEDIAKVPKETIEKIQTMLKTINKVFDFAILLMTYQGMKTGYDFEFFNEGDEIDFDSFEGLPIAKITKDSITPIKN